MIEKGLSVCRLGYDAAVSYKFPTSGHVLVFTGSSLNRKRNENKSADKNIEQEKKKVGKKNSGVHATGSINELRNIRDNKDLQQGNIDVRKKKKLYSIGRKAKQLIRNRGAAMYRCGRCKTIVTLSFIAPVTDAIAIRCLQNYIRSWRANYAADINYLWVAERQQNGNVHFHIITSKFYDIQKENARWIRVQYNAGLVFRDQCGFEIDRWEIETMIKAGILKQHLNPFDVKKIHTQGGVISYITKYITKGKGKKDDTGKSMDQFEFHPWRCSHAVSRVFTGVLAQKETMDYMLSEKNSRTQHKDYFKDGKLKYPKGYVHSPLPYYGQWATKIAIYNDYLAGGQYRPLDEINRRILISGEKPALEQISAYDYYVNYCRPVTFAEINLANEGAYINEFSEKRDRLFYDDQAILRCDSFNGKVNEFGRYRLKSGFYDVSPWTSKELILM